MSRFDKWICFFGIVVIVTFGVFLWRYDPYPAEQPMLRRAAGRAHDEPCTCAQPGCKICGHACDCHDGYLGDLGPGSELVVDDGYYPQTGWKWVPLLKEVQVVGEYQGLVVTVPKGKDGRLYADEFITLRPEFDNRVQRVLRRVKGERPQWIVPTVAIKEGP